MRTRFIEGWPKYLITDDGRVWSEKSGKYLKPQTLSKGYLGVSFYPGPKPRAGKCMKIHQLVAKAFVPNLDGLPEVNHADGNKKNNVPENLEWITTIGNSHHALANDLRGKATKLKVAQVIEIREFLRSGMSGKSLAKRYGVGRPCISHIKTGKSWSSVKGGL